MFTAGQAALSSLLFSTTTLNLLTRRDIFDKTKFEDLVLDNVARRHRRVALTSSDNYYSGACTGPAGSYTAAGRGSLVRMASGGLLP